MKKNIFNILQKINHKPKPYEYYTTPELWRDPHISKQMLDVHISDETELASRKKDFIDRSAEWIVKHFQIKDDFKICDFGCGPGLYTIRFAKYSKFITGIDFSKNSINYAIEQAKQNRLNINYILQDYLKFETDEKFDLITLIYCDFCTLNPEQRKLLLKKFYGLLKNGGKILLDVSSFAKYNTGQENLSYEYSATNGFWSAEPYHVFHNHFKYEKEHLLLDKFTIIESEKITIGYNVTQLKQLPKNSNKMVLKLLNTIIM